MTPLWGSKPTQRRGMLGPLSPKIFHLKMCVFYLSVAHPIFGHYGPGFGPVFSSVIKFNCQDQTRKKYSSVCESAAF